MKKAYGTVREICTEIVYLGFAVVTVLILCGVYSYIFPEHENARITYNINMQFFVFNIVVHASLYFIRRQKITLAHRVSAFIASYSILMVYFISFIMGADRSLTVSMLDYLHGTNIEESYSAAEVQQAFIENSICKNGAIEKRLEEHQISGFIAKNAKGEYYLTSGGHYFRDFFVFNRKFFSIPAHPASDQSYCKKPLYTN